MEPHVTPPDPVEAESSPPNYRRYQGPDHGLARPAHKSAHDFWGPINLCCEPFLGFLGKGAKAPIPAIEAKHDAAGRAGHHAAAKPWMARVRLVRLMKPIAQSPGQSPAAAVDNFAGARHYIEGPTVSSAPLLRLSAGSICAAASRVRYSRVYIRAAG